MNEGKCQIIVPFGQGIWIAKDAHGCIKPSNHNGAHISKLDDGRHIEWEEDYNCECGCWYSEYDADEVCKIYSFLTDEEVSLKLTA